MRVELEERLHRPAATPTFEPRLGQILHEDNPNRKADNLCELTKLGQRQGREAGRRVRQLLGDGARISAVVSPFERTQQTLYCMQQELQDDDELPLTLTLTLALTP